MNYIIELDVFFAPEDKTLSLSNDRNNSVSLSNQANRLLLEMVISKNEVLNREDLIKRVWEDYGFTSSNNSLYVAVSEIRKAFSSLGKNPQIITTIPKVGFRFEGVVLPVSVDQKLTITPNEIEKNVGRSIILTHKVIILTLMIMVIFSLSWLIRTHIKNELKTDIEYKKLMYTDNLCKIYMLGHDVYGLNDIKNDIERELFKCEKQRVDIFYERTKSAGLFIGACTLEQEGKYLSCITIKKQKRGDK